MFVFGWELPANRPFFRFLTETTAGIEGAAFGIVGSEA